MWDFKIRPEILICLNFEILILFFKKGFKKIIFYFLKNKIRFRSKLEVYKFSKVQRGMKQLQALLDFYDSQECSKSMLPFFFPSHLGPRWELRRQLCDAYVKLGLVQSALDEYMALNMFEEACQCYIGAFQNKTLQDFRLEKYNFVRTKNSPLSLSAVC